MTKSFASACRSRRRSVALASIALFAASTLDAATNVDWILTARHGVTMDANRRVIEDVAVAVRGDRIVAVGPRAAIDKEYRAAQRIDAGNALLAPGLINTHTHAAMSLFRGIADDLRLQDWLEKFIFPAESRNVNPEFVRWGTRLACLEMLQSGTTTFTDMYYFEEVVGEVAREAGIRGVLGQTVIGFPVADAKTPAESLARTERFFKQFASDALVTPAVAPHAIYTNSDETLRAARALADRYGKPLLIHLSETKNENDDVRAKRRVSPTQVLDALGLWKGRSVAAHGVWLDDADIKILAARGVGVAHCPASNMKLASGVAPVAKMLRAGVAVGLGPDGPAGSNNDFNLWEEMDLAGKLAKVSSGDPAVLPAEQIVAMATIGGARALGLDRETGSLEAGKRADILIATLDQAHAAPFYNAYSQMVYALKGGDVRHVMVNGKLVVRDGKSLTLDSAAILKKAAEYRAAVTASLKPR